MSDCKATVMYGMGFLPLRSPLSYRQCKVLQFPSQNVVLCDEKNIIHHSDGKQDLHIGTHRNRWGSFFYSPECRSADAGTLGYQFNRQTSSEAGKFNLMSHCFKLGRDAWKQDDCFLSHVGNIGVIVSIRKPYCL